MPIYWCSELTQKNKKEITEQTNKEQNIDEFEKNVLLDQFPYIDEFENKAILDQFPFNAYITR